MNDTSAPRSADTTPAQPETEAKSRRRKLAHATRQRHRRMAELRELRAENEVLHRRLAAVYDALNLE